MALMRSFITWSSLMLLAACGFGDFSAGGYNPTGPTMDCNPNRPGIWVSLDPPSATIEVGRAVWFNRQIGASGAGACFSSSSFTSSDTAVAVITEAGDVLGVAPGVVTITFSSGSAIATSAVTVLPLTTTFVALGGGLFQNMDLLSSGGDVYGWGSGIPEAVWGAVKFSAVDGGPNRTCGVTPARLAYCWGFPPPGGGFGNGLWQPTQEPGLSDVVAIDAGGTDHVCALTGSGVVLCWGSNASGQLGTGASTAQTTSEPQAVAGGHVFRALALGDSHSCALAEDGSAWCWGDNGRGQLGVDSAGATCGTPAQPCQPVPVRAAAPLTFVALAAGAWHTCGIAADAQAYCWGLNVSGQLGTGDTLSGSAPRLVSGGLSFITLTATGGATCGLTTAGDAYCWGYSGGWWATGRSTPHLVSGGLHFDAIAIGRTQTCGVAARVAYCWDVDNDGPPVRVAGQAN